MGIYTTGEGEEDGGGGGMAGKSSGVVMFPVCRYRCYDFLLRFIQPFSGLAFRRFFYFFPPSLEAVAIRYVWYGVNGGCRLMYRCMFSRFSGDR